MSARVLAVSAKNRAERNSISPKGYAVSITIEDMGQERKWGQGCSENGITSQIVA